MPQSTSLAWQLPLKRRANPDVETDIWMIQIRKMKEIKDVQKKTGENQKDFVGANLSNPLTYSRSKFGTEDSYQNTAGSLWG